MDTIEKIIVWAGTPWGKIVVQGLSVFVFCEFFIRLLLSQGLKVLTSISKQKREFISNATGLLSNFTTGIALALVIHWGHGAQHIIFQSWYLIIIAMGAHVIYIRYLHKIITKKFGID